MTDFGGKTSIFSHPVYLFLREFSLQDFRGGSQLKQAMEKIGSLDQAVKERDKSIMDLNQTIETMNKAEQHFHSQEVKNESEQAKYADRQMERKAEVQKQLVAAGNVRQRIPADTQRLLRESISEFNADADKG
ncbi:ppfA [Escherichia coli]